MRAALSAFAAACLMAPMPALAAEAEGQAADIAEDLTDPARQAEIAAMVETMANLMLEMPAAPLLRAAATMAGEDPEAVDETTTVGDLAGPEAAEMPREFAQRLPQMMSAMAIMAAAFEDMAPLMRERLEQALPPDTH
jgi:hypothetical protein